WCQNKSAVARPLNDWFRLPRVYLTVRVRRDSEKDALSDRSEAASEVMRSPGLVTIASSRCSDSRRGADAFSCHLALFPATWPTQLRATTRRVHRRPHALSLCHWHRRARRYG